MHLQSVNPILPDREKVFVGHPLHDSTPAAPKLLLYLSLPHSIHVALLVAPNVTEYVDMGQGVHADEPAAEYVPIGHDVHVTEPDAMKVPAGHSVQYEGVCALGLVSNKVRCAAVTVLFSSRVNTRFQIKIECTARLAVDSVHILKFN